mmetsp:Transcript_35046/g.65412  ORF Transcript_35046/g.65412 Transcript_35046/m.65412 type:complete len:222 (+) Transcript_35046:2538-3203(+)
MSGVQNDRPSSSSPSSSACRAYLSASFTSRSRSVSSACCNQAMASSFIRRLFSLSLRLRSSSAREPLAVRFTVEVATSSFSLVSPLTSPISSSTMTSIPMVLRSLISSIAAASCGPVGSNGFFAFSPLFSSVAALGLALLFPPLAVELLLEVESFCCSFCCLRMLAASLAARHSSMACSRNSGSTVFSFLLSSRWCFHMRVCWFWRSSWLRISRCRTWLLS